MCDTGVGFDHVFASFVALSLWEENLEQTLSHLVQPFPCFLFYNIKTGTLQCYRYFVAEISLDLVAVPCSHWAFWKRDITDGKWGQFFIDAFLDSWK